MNYEKKYNEALERMKSWVRGEHPECFTEAKKTAEFIFPELKESEDEKIKKELCKAIWTYIPNEEAHEYIAWLEKQGKQKPQGKSALEAIKEEKIDNANKVEPKFHEGEWITDGKHNRLVIDGHSPLNYTLLEQDGNILSGTIENIQYTHHLWTIQDAKNGDVLIEDSCIFIIQKLGDNSTAAKTYCTLYNDGDFNDGSILYFDIDSTKPATKEQRDTLEKAMADAGYIFNFESKELRKIEKPIEWSYEDEANLNNIIWLCNNCIKGTETTWIPSQATKIKHLIETIKEEGLAQQNPAWSEEDEQIILSIEQAMNCASLLNIVPEKMDKIRTWLKSLKDRVGCEANCTTTKEWSESDKEEFQIAVDTLVEAGQHDSAHWLKSLKDRYTWKPSSIQMECLYDAIHHYQTNGYPASKLNELYEQMSNIYKL